MANIAAVHPAALTPTITDKPITLSQFSRLFRPATVCNALRRHSAA